MFIVAKKWGTKGPSVHENVICPYGDTLEYAMGYYWARKRNEVYWYMPRWGQTLKTSGVKEATQYMIPFVGNIQNRLTHRDKRWVRGCRGAVEYRYSVAGFFLG